MQLKQFNQYHVRVSLCVCVSCSCCLIYWHIQSCCYSLLYLHLQQFPRSPTIIIGSLCVNNCEFVYIAWRSLCFPLVFAPLALLPATYIRTHVQRLYVCVCEGSLIWIPTVQLLPLWSGTRICGGVVRPALFMPSSAHHVTNALHHTSHTHHTHTTHTRTHP